MANIYEKKTILKKKNLELTSCKSGENFTASTIFWEV